MKWKKIFETLSLEELLYNLSTIFSLMKFIIDKNWVSSFEYFFNQHNSNQKSYSEKIIHNLKSE